MNSLKSSDQSSLDSLGGGRDGIIKIARIGWILEYGGSDSAISIAVIPKDHTSAFPSIIEDSWRKKRIQCNEIGNIYNLKKKGYL